MDVLQIAITMANNQPPLVKKISVVKKILLGVPNEAVLLRITNVHLNIKRSLN